MSSDGFAMRDPSEEEVNDAIASILRTEIEQSPPVRLQRVINELKTARAQDQFIMQLLACLETEAHTEALETAVYARRWRGCAVWLVAIIMWILVWEAL